MSQCVKFNSIKIYNLVYFQPEAWCAAEGEQSYVFIFVFQQVQGNPFYRRPSSMKEEVMHKSKHKLGWMWEAEWGGGGGGRRPAGRTQRITMVTAITGLRGGMLGPRGRLERQLTEESALTPDDPTDSSPPPPGLCRTSPLPKERRVYRTGMQPFLFQGKELTPRNIPVFHWWKCKNVLI